jgi:uracil-DNA glycosylase
MQAKGQGRAPSKTPSRVPATDDEIREKYLERAIRELNQLTREV